MDISEETMKNMPSRNEFYTRLVRLGIMDKDGNIDNERMLALETVSQEEL